MILDNCFEVCWACTLGQPHHAKLERESRLIFNEAVLHTQTAASAKYRIGYLFGKILTVEKRQHSLDWGKWVTLKRQTGELATLQLRAHCVRTVLRWRRQQDCRFRAIRPAALPFGLAAIRLRAPCVGTVLRRRRQRYRGFGALCLAALHWWPAAPHSVRPATSSGLTPDPKYLNIEMKINSQCPNAKSEKQTKVRRKTQLECQKPKVSQSGKFIQPQQQLRKAKDLGLQ